MHTVTVNALRPIELADYRRRGAKLTDTSQLVKEPTRWVDGQGRPLVIYTQVDRPLLEPLRTALRQVRYVEDTRSGGMVTRSRIFGYAPRLALRNRACRRVSLAEEQPEAHSIICDTGRLAWDVYQRLYPEGAAHHNKLATDHVLDQWRIQATPFTSGIANHNNPLVYHFDSGNFKGVWSAMFVLKGGVAGGHLSIPELDVALDCADCSLVLFDGQSLLHGVTPISKQHADAYRYSVVYYSLQGMWSCQTITDELAKMRATRTAIELKRAGKAK